MNKNNLAYFILGLGFGIVLTSTIYSLNPNIKYKEYSEEEIIKNATDLGMVFVKDTIDISGKNNKEEKGAENVEEEKEIILIVEAGDNAEKVFNKLFQLGVIEDKKDFSNYAKKKNIEKRIRIGTYKLAQNMDYDQIINVLTKSSK